VKKRRDEKTAIYARSRRKRKCKPPEEVINNKPDAKQELIRSFASIIVRIMLSDNSKGKL
jgi:hypothetical protein